MITFLREFCTKDLGLKLLSLGLSILIYWAVSIFALRTDQRTMQSLALSAGYRVFPKLPVLVMSSAADVRQFKVSPEEVTVTVQGAPELLARLENREIRALVDLTGMEAGRDLTKRIEISVPAGVTQVRVVPAEVRVFPPKR